MSKRTRKRKPKEVVRIPRLKFNMVAITARLGLIDLEELLGQVFEAIGDAKGMAGALPPDECDDRRAELDQLQATITFVFGVAPNKEDQR